MAKEKKEKVDAVAAENEELLEHFRGELGTSIDNKVEKFISTRFDSFRLCNLK
jgi:hypothetical protein